MEPGSVHDDDTDDDDTDDAVATTGRPVPTTEVATRTARLMSWCSSNHITARIPSPHR